MIIRDESPGDVAAIRRVNIDAFPTTAEADLIERLRESEVGLISLVAEEADGEVIGHILFSPIEAPEGDAVIMMLGLAPMSVIPSKQNRGIGSALVVAGLGRCEAVGCDAVVVLGHANYYPRFGFVPASTFGITSEYEVPDEVFMLKELKKGALDGCAGVVRYHHAFREL